MNDINKLFEEIEKVEQENLIEELGLTERELKEHKDNPRLRKIMYLMMEGVMLASKMTGDRVLEELCLQRCQQFWSLLSLQEREAMKQRNISTERIGMTLPEQWVHDFDDSELGKGLWSLFIGVQDGELLEIQSEHNDHMANLENRIETLEALVMKLGQKLSSLTLPEETK